MTRLAAGKAAQSQDAMWYDVKTRNQAIDSLGKKGESSTRPTSTNRESSLLGGIFGGLSSIVGSVASFGGSVITGALGVIARVSPILGIIALLAGGYVIKELAKVVKFNEIKDSIMNSIMNFLGIDSKSEKGFFQQWMEKLDESFDTKKFTEIYGTINKTITERFGPQIDLIGQSIQRATNVTLAYAKAAFETLADAFVGIGDAVGFLLNEFFEGNKGKIFAAITLGTMGPAALTSLKGAAGVAAVTTLAGAFGAATGDKTREQLKVEIENYNKQIEKYSNSNIAAERNSVPERIMQRDRAISELNAKQREFEGKLFGRNRPSFSDRLTAELARVDPSLVGADYEGGSNFGTIGKFGNQTPPAAAPAEPSSRAPSQILSKQMRINNVGVVTSLFGNRENPLKPGSGEMQFHKGVDVFLPKNTPLEALTDGKVIAAKFDSASGNMISIEDANGNVFTYKHLESLGVKEGDIVKRGQVIGKSGKSGYASTGPHLHLEAKDKQGNYRSPTLEELQNAITKGQRVSAASIDNVDLARASMFPGEGGGNTINTTNNNYSGGRGDSQSFDSALNYDAIELFVRNT
jgi:murein DD-endopeptidase MepM/ murein hydrolase activator NlpD